MVFCTLYAVSTSLPLNLYNPLNLGIHPYTEIPFIKVISKSPLSICNDQFLLLILLIPWQDLTLSPGSQAITPPLLSSMDDSTNLFQFLS